MWGLSYLITVVSLYYELRKTAKEFNDAHLTKVKIEEFVESLRFVVWAVVLMTFLVLELIIVFEVAGFRTTDELQVLGIFFFMIPAPFFFGKWVSLVVMNLQKMYFNWKYNLNQTGDES